MKVPYRLTLSFALLLNLLLPGAGYFLWKEMLFGLFVFLIMLLAAALGIVQFLIPLPQAALWLLLGLPLLFYLFTFVDLARTVRTKRAKLIPTAARAGLILAISLIYQLVSPSAFVNFGLRNFPEFSTVSDSHLGPLYRQGDIVIANRLAYTADIPFLDRPVLHALPERFDLVRFVGENGRHQSGFVLGLATELIEIVDGALTADDAPINVGLPSGFALTGQWPLTEVADYSILVGTFNLGTLDNLQQVRLDSVVGRVSSFY
jgi:hypothetical protein